MTTEEAKEMLDNQLREILTWHFSEQTGCPFWLDWKKEADWDPREEVQSFDDIHPENDQIYECHQMIGLLP
jgi:hypothetical protein